MFVCQYKVGSIVGSQEVRRHISLIEHVHMLLYDY